MRNNRGITLVEIIVTVALMVVVLPFAWNYINSSIQDDATLNNKVMVQSSVNALMNQFQRDTQEARYPINPSEDYREIGDVGFLICKPGDTSVIYNFDEEKKLVTLTTNLKLMRDGLRIIGIEQTDETEVSTYNYIKEINPTLLMDSKGGYNGLEVYIRGEIDSKSGYTLTNKYYTRNTLFE